MDWDEPNHWYGTCRDADSSRLGKIKIIPWYADLSRLGEMMIPMRRRFIASRRKEEHPVCSIIIIYETKKYVLQMNKNTLIIHETKKMRFVDK